LTEALSATLEARTSLGHWRQRRILGVGCYKHSLEKLDQTRSFIRSEHGLTATGLVVTGNQVE
jgi:hypothetical protein